MQLQQVQQEKMEKDVCLDQRYICLGRLIEERGCAKTRWILEDHYLSFTGYRPYKLHSTETAARRISLAMLVESELSQIGTFLLDAAFQTQGPTSQCNMANLSIANTSSISNAPDE
jgi:hypothetical protein